MQVIPKISLQTILLPFLPSHNLSYHYSPPILRPLPLLYFHAPLTLQPPPKIGIIPIPLRYSLFPFNFANLFYQIQTPER